ncbi:stemmadenine O-acetyltransferase-like [Punica granatum]|uniref:Stemmadenine O-acetyltransferase-like n=1 Tax=Punica granatum TaxID=22663 RepID=A0A6P8BUV9_PUNGR|nr:stemmadenine O-acetyltransferase-like [Punica granatum]
MAMKVETVSTETIRPSSPTKSNLKTFKISLLDQLAPPFYVPVVLFYSSAPSDINVSEKLKTSLSQTLSSFYPFCGRLKENASIDCSDQGALFVEARARFPLSRVLTDPDILGLQQFLPFPPYKLSSEEEVVLGVKVSFFECGGVGIGVCISHKIADGCSVAQFLISWAEAGLGIGSSSGFGPRLDASMIFPPKVVNFPMPAGVISDEKLVTKRFRFNGKGLAQLKAEFPGLKPTRVEAVTALIWKTALEVVKIKPGGSGIYPPSAVTHIVNIRSRASPPLPEQTLGNLWQSAVAPLMDMDKQAPQLHDLMALLRKSIRRMNGDFVRELREENRLAKACESLMSARKLASTSGVRFELYRFSSWTRFPFYEADFGWGRPAWVCTTSVPMKNVVILMGTGLEDEGIEAWVTLTEADMVKFEAYEALLQFVMPPSH